MRRAIRCYPLLAGAVTLALLSGTAGVAWAHFVFQKDYTFQSDSTCTLARSEASHGGGGGYSKSDVIGRKQAPFGPWGSINCGADDIRAAGQLALRFDWWKWTGSDWAICAGTDWYFNPNATWHYSIHWDYGASPWCGDGYYGTMTYAYNQNGGWQGGALWSGFHLLPA